MRRPQETNETSYRAAAALGAAAGVAACTIQAGVGFVIQNVCLPPGEDNNISPRFVRRLFQATGHGRNEVRDWSLGTVFHVAYGVFWGAMMGLLARGLRLPALALAVPEWIVIYLLAFSRLGAGTATKTERDPKRRPLRKELSLIAVAGTYAVSAALILEWLLRAWPELTEAADGAVDEAADQVADEAGELVDERAPQPLHGAR